jgi:cell division protein ZipA
MTLPGPQQSITAFNYMIETAQVLVRNLNAELRDDAHSVMTAQTIEHCRQRIRDFERKQLTLQL